MRNTVRAWPRVALLSAGLFALTLALLTLLPAEQAGTHPSSAAPATADEAAGQPNIVVVMADDMRSDDLEFAPALRRMFTKHGLTFKNSFSSFPLCCPARASFLTGTYPHNHHVYWHEAPYAYGAFDDSRTLATSLSSVGYNTGFIGKYLNKYGDHRSLVSGKPSWNYVPRGWTDWRAAFSDPGLAGVHGGVYNYFDTPYNINGLLDNSHRGTYQSVVVGDFATSMARRFSSSRRRTGKPFFMYVNFVAPHNGGPHESDDPEFNTPARPAWVRGRFDRVRRASGIPRGGGPTEARMSDKRSDMRKLSEPSPRERAALAEVTRQRAEAIFALDRQVNRLVRQLKASGQWGRTIFVFTSDNGYFLGEHRLRPGKARTYEPSLRVPILVTGPGMRTGRAALRPDQPGRPERHDPRRRECPATAAGGRAEPPRHHAARRPGLGASGGHRVLLPLQAPARPRRDLRRTPRRRSARPQVRLHQVPEFRGALRPAQGPLPGSERRVSPAVRRRPTPAAGNGPADSRLRRRGVPPPLPDALAASPALERELTSAWWRAMGRRYGW